MKLNFFILVLLFLFVHAHSLLFAQPSAVSSVKFSDEDVAQTYYNLMDSLSEAATDPLFKLHFQSMKKVVLDKGYLSPTDLSLISETLKFFYDIDAEGNPSDATSYLNRQRPLVIAWESPTDYNTSFTRVKLPQNWDPEQSYPLYVDLHGLWDVAQNPVSFMTYSFRRQASSSPSIAYEDGFELAMWGRGNYWYEGISETDIWEGIEVIEKLFKIDRYRKYITGHSMGGYGAWSIASRSANVWAGVGVHAGALSHGAIYQLSDDIVSALKDLPVYITCGSSDGLFGINYEAYLKLLEAGNSNVEFVPFNGGHDYLQINVENMYLWLHQFERDEFSNTKNQWATNHGKIILYPNLVSGNDKLNLKLSCTRNLAVELINLYGKRVAILPDQVYETGIHSLDLSFSLLPKGIYICKLNTEKETFCSKIIVE